MCTPKPGTFDFNFHLVRTARDIAAKNEARAMAIAAAPTKLKQSVTRLAHAVQDYDESIRLEHTSPPLLSWVDPKPLAEAAMELARTVKSLFPAHRVPELIRLERALRDYHDDPGPADQLPAVLMNRIEEAVTLGQELLLIPDDLSHRTARALLPRQETTIVAGDVRAMPGVRIYVVGADGQRRGSFFKDHADYKHRWWGPTQPGSHESMVCHPNLEEGSYYLIEYVLPQQIEGSELRGDQIDQASTCRQLTLPQALHWFSNQVFGPPPSLVARTRDYAEAIEKVDASAKARSLAQAMCDRRSVADDDALFAGNRAELKLLLAARLVYGNESEGKTTYSVDSVVQELGADEHVAWVLQQIDLVQNLLRPRDRKTPPIWSPSLHQQIVLKFLRKNGRTRTGVLWERLTPKHVDRRAHQIQMSVLVREGAVLRDGKGVATEYWVPESRK